MISNTIYRINNYPLGFYYKNVFESRKIPKSVSTIFCIYLNFIVEKTLHAPVDGGGAAALVERWRSLVVLVRFVLIAAGQITLKKVKNVLKLTKKKKTVEDSNRRVNVEERKRYFF